MYQTNYYSTYKRNTELYHHGILGMKWGVRRYQNYGEGGYNPKNKRELNKRNKNYSDMQRLQDRTFYGKGAERRINRKMNEGKNIITARHEEIARKKRIEAGKQFVATAVSSYLLYDHIKNGNNSLISKGAREAQYLINEGYGKLKTLNLKAAANAYDKLK